MDEQRTPDHLRTVAGPLAPDAVRGPVLAHEHLALDLSRGGDPAAVLDGGHRDAVGAELAQLREEFGLSLVVELTCRGMGRDAGALARVSAESGVAVVAGTGWYYERFQPAEVAGADPERLALSLIREIEEGIDDADIDASPSPETAALTGEHAEEVPSGSGLPGTRIRPGVIGEAGSHGDRPTAQEARTLTAAALAARATGLSVATHAQLGRGGPAQLELLTRTGLPPHRVSLGHQDLLEDPGVHRELAAEGAYIAFDTVGKENYADDDARLRLLRALLEAGHAERALLSCDVSRYGYLTARGGTGYGHLFRSFLPKLRAAGADDDLVDLLTRRNPLRFLTGGTAGGGARETAKDTRPTGTRAGAGTGAGTGAAAHDEEKRGAVR